MKKSFLPANLLAVVLMLALLLAAGCTPDGNGNGDVEGELEEENDEQVATDPADNGNGENSDETADNDTADPVTPGDEPVIDGALLYFGKTAPEIISELGEPSEIDFHDGSEYYYYEKMRIAVFFWADLPGDVEVVRAVSLLEDWSVAGVSEGMTFTEIKDVLGEPFYEGMEDRNMLVIDYHQFRFFFYADSETEPVTNVLIKYLDDC